MIRVRTELEVASSADLRKEIIDDIRSPENLTRKEEAYRRHKLMKDKTKDFVKEELLQQFDESTVREMEYSIANISIARKIIEKLARVYSSGVDREAVVKAQPKDVQKPVETVDKDPKEVVGKEKKDLPEVKPVPLDPAEEETKQIEELARLLCLNTQMKRANKYLKAQRNCLVGVLPCEFEKINAKEYGLKIHVLEPYLYDAVEHEYDRERAVYYVISDYQPNPPKALATVDPAKHNDVIPRDKVQGPPPAAEDNTKFIWWSDGYHFTTNAKGEIVSGGDSLNPILENPYVSFAIEPDGKFWAEGGDDVFDGAIRVNNMITNIDHIGVVQGYGQFWMKGKGLPKVVKTGPTKVILMEMEDKDDPDMEIGYAQANPKLEELKEQIIMYVALLLSTNNLSTRSVAAELSGSTDVASGIAIMLDKAESTEDVQDQQQLFIEKEPALIRKSGKWLELYKSRNLLSEEWKAVKVNGKTNCSIRFHEGGTIMSEKEKLENLKMRKDLGINTMLELLMKDDPTLTVEQAEKKLMNLLEEKMKMAAMLPPPPKPGEKTAGKPGEEETTDEGDPEQGDEPGDIEQD